MKDVFYVLRGEDEMYWDGESWSYSFDDAEPMSGPDAFDDVKSETDDVIRVTWEIVK